MFRVRTAIHLSVPGFNLVFGFGWLASGWRAALSAVLLFSFSGCHEGPSAPPPDSAAIVTNRATHLEARERHIDETVWAKEMLAQKCGQVFESLWDGLNAATNKLEVAAAFPLGQIALGTWDRVENLPHQIENRVSSGPGPVLSETQWRQFVSEFQRAGWQLVQSEFRHNQFEPDSSGHPWKSRFHLAAHLTNSARLERAVLEGDFLVQWAANGETNSRPASVEHIDAAALTIKTRHGEAPFQLLFADQDTPTDKTPWMDPLMVYDLDGDGYPEIILLAKNRLYRRTADVSYKAAILCRYPPSSVVFTGLLADFDGDGLTDLLCVTEKGLILFQGSEKGSFDQPGELVWEANGRLANPMVLTCGDIDHDGDLDLFLGQYRVPTLGQVFRPNYYDANDGHPAHLLLNNGHGRFTDVTAAAGLDKKRGRRVFSASFVDLNEDGHLDLVVTSDFAGADLYRNDGHGHFEDVTDQWLPDSRGFGMGQAVADFNQDGRLDFLMLGMNSPSADRLEHLQLERPLPGTDRTMRGRMTYGNRLYLGRTGGGFEQTELGQSVARSGWSWGCSVFDCDNDGFPDIYITNGHDSRQTVREYEPEFWLHDIYIDSSVDDLSATAYYMAKFARTRGQGWSYGGWDKNRLYLNQQGASFLEVAYLFGVGAEADSRCVATADLDNDGRMDLLFTTVQQWPQSHQTLQVYQNHLTDTGHWIGFQLHEAPGRSPIGAQLRLRWAGHETIRAIVTGDSFRTQHPSTVHFGLGSAAQVDEVEVRWPNREISRLRNPAIDRYHRLEQPH